MDRADGLDLLRQVKANAVSGADTPTGQPRGDAVRHMLKLAITNRPTGFVFDGHALGVPSGGLLEKVAQRSCCDGLKHVALSYHNTT